ncbi:MAG: hypothetical protein MUQ75_04700 [Crocinitomicaceae bacterium]|nr:hypothetical protein [Crocinitomicaceae bacterium]
MCDCEKKVVDLSHLKIYTVMAEYKAKKDVVLIRDGERFILRESSQEELSYLYEDLGLTSLVEKLSTTKTKDEPKKATKKKKSGKESSDSKE